MVGVMWDQNTKNIIPESEKKMTLNYRTKNNRTKHNQNWKYRAEQTNANQNNRQGDE
jgi:hypothetical protein